MSKFAIVADATCDLNDNFQKEYDIHVVSSHITLPDRTEFLSTMQWERFTREEFYTALKKNPAGYFTAPANTTEFAAIFEKYAAQGTDVLAMSISSGISGTFNFMQQARAQVLESYPQARIVCVDSLRFGPGFGLMVVYAAMQRNAGMDVEQTAAYLEQNKNRFHQAGWLDDLSFVAKKGRITHAKAFFGTLAGIKSIGEFDYNGLTTVIGKAKGAKSAYSLLLSYIEKTIENPQEQIIFIAQTNRLEQANAYKAMIEEKFHPKAVYVNDVFPPCGINIGPGLMAAYYVGKPISEGLTEEKALLEALISGDAT